MKTRIYATPAVKGLKVILPRVYIAWIRIKCLLIFVRLRPIRLACQDPGWPAGRTLNQPDIRLIVHESKSNLRRFLRKRVSPFAPDCAEDTD